MIITITSAEIRQGIGLCEYSYQDHPITWWGYRCGRLDLDTSAGSYEGLELPLTVTKTSR